MLFLLPESVMAMTMPEATPMPPAPVWEMMPPLSGVIDLSVIYGYHKTVSAAIVRYIDKHRTHCFASSPIGSQESDLIDPAIAMSASLSSKPCSVCANTIRIWTPSHRLVTRDIQYRDGHVVPIWVSDTLNRYANEPSVGRPQKLNAWICTRNIGWTIMCHASDAVQREMLHVRPNVSRIHFAI